MKNQHCIVCKNYSFEVIWNDKIRSGRNIFTKKKQKILKCKNCNLIFLQKKNKDLEDSSLARKIYNKNNSLEEFYNFHNPRETKKLEHILNFIKIKNKNILESNCGFGILLNRLKKKTKSTTGVDSNFYKKKIISNGHNFFLSFDEIIKNKFIYDIIFSLSELEHKLEPIKFLQKLRSSLSDHGKIVLRVPNYENLYKLLLEKYYCKYDFRTSHNYYFSLKNLKLIFNKVNLKINNIIGYNEYNFNHLIEYIQIRKRPHNKYKNVIKKQNLMYLNKNIENNLLSTSFIFILSKKKK